MKIVEIDCIAINDWGSFHSIFAKSFGFPSFYGNNMNAWIDCLTSLDAPEDGMTSIHVGPGEALTLSLLNIKHLQESCPDIYSALVECSAFVNWRRVKNSEPPVLALAFDA